MGAMFSKLSTFLLNTCSFPKISKLFDLSEKKIKQIFLFSFAEIIRENFNSMFLLLFWQQERTVPDWKQVVGKRPFSKKY
jgi:hypothetical protein